MLKFIEITAKIPKPLGLGLKNVEDIIYMAKAMKKKDRTFYLREKLYIICLNNNLSVMGIAQLSEGHESSSLCSFSQIMTILSLTSCKRFALVHNHPCGDVMPSLADKRLFKEFRKKFNYIGYDFVDSFIITTNTFYSCQMKKAFNYKPNK